MRHLMLETGNEIQTTENTAGAVQLIDKAFSVRSSKDFILYIFFDHTHLTCTALHPEQKTFRTLHSFPFDPQRNSYVLTKKLKSLFEDESILQLKYKEVVIAHGDERFTLVPEHLFDDKASLQYLELNHTISGQDNIQIDTLKHLAAKRIYAVPNDMEDLLKGYFPDARLMHSSTPLCTAISKQNEFEEADQIYVHVQSEFIEIMLFRNKDMKYDNRFRYRSTSDLIYFVLFVYERLSLNPSKVQLTFIGNVHPDGEVSIEAKQFIQNIRFGECPDSCRYSKSFNDTPLLPYYNLFSIYECAS